MRLVYLPLVMVLPPRDTFKDAWLKQYIPPEVPLATNLTLAPHLINRPTIYLTSYTGHTAARTLPDFLPELDYVLVDALFDFSIGNQEEVFVGGVLYERDSLRRLLQSPNFGLIQADDGLLLFKQGAIGLSQTLEMIPFNQPPPLVANFQETIGLVNAELQPLGPYHFQLIVDWVALPNLLNSVNQTPPLDFIAMSQPGNLLHARLVHLPTHALLPTSQWPADHLTRETIQFRLPDTTPPGSYPLIVNWHNAHSIFALATDARSRLGEPFQVGILVIGEKD